MTTLLAAVEVTVDRKTRYCWNDGFWLKVFWILQFVILNNQVAELMMSLPLIFLFLFNHTAMHVVGRHSKQ
jgi:hypothetical protein